MRLGSVVADRHAGPQRRRRACASDIGFGLYRFPIPDSRIPAPYP
ncbi:UNVERIFIED_ORG: hypothetical protein ABIB63_001339 [Xanthomonas axonopodis]